MSEIYITGALFLARWAFAVAYVLAAGGAIGFWVSARFRGEGSPHDKFGVASVVVVMLLTAWLVLPEIITGTDI
jgi:hypothetical protein